MGGFAEGDGELLVPWDDASNLFQDSERITEEIINNVK